MKGPRDFKIGDIVFFEGKKLVVSWITNYCLYFTNGDAIKYEFLE